MPSISILPLPTAIPSRTSSLPSPSPASTTAPTRSFPVHGSLGVSPVSIAGLVVLTRSHPQDRPLQASAVEVALKCYESKLGGAFAVVASELLWASQPTVLWTAAVDGAATGGGLAEWEGKFKVGVPVDAGKDKGRSTVSLKEYRVVWKLEVVITHRTPANPNERLVKSIEVPILQHASPTLPPTPITGLTPSFTLSSATTSVPVTIELPSAAYGPGETIPIHLSGLAPANRATVRRIVVSLRRKVAFLPSPPTPASAGSIYVSDETASSDWSSEVGTPFEERDLVVVTPSSDGSSSFYEMGVMDSSASLASFSTNAPLMLSPTSGRSKATSRLTSFFSPKSTTASLPSRKSRDPSPMSAEPPRLCSRSPSASSSSSSVGVGGKMTRRASTPPPIIQVVTTKVLEAETTVLLSPLSKDWEANVDLVLPRVKGSSRWTMGETGRTGMVDIGFELKVTVIVQPHSSSSTDASTSTSFITPSAVHMVVPETFPVFLTSTSLSERKTAATLPPSSPRTRSSTSRSKASSSTASGTRASSGAGPSSPTRPRMARPTQATRSISASSGSSMYSLGNGSSFRGLEGESSEAHSRSSSPRSSRRRREDHAESPRSPLSPSAGQQTFDLDPRSARTSSCTASGSHPYPPPSLHHSRSEEHRPLLSESSLVSSNASTSTVKLHAYPAPSPSPSSSYPAAADFNNFSTTSFDTIPLGPASTSSYSSARRPSSSKHSPPIGFGSASAAFQPRTDVAASPFTSPIQPPPPHSSRPAAKGRFFSLSPGPTTAEDDFLLGGLIHGGRRISINPVEEEELLPSRQKVRTEDLVEQKGWGGPVAAAAGTGRSAGNAAGRRPSTAPGGPVGGVGGFGFGRWGKD